MILPKDRPVKVAHTFILASFEPGEMGGSFPPFTCSATKKTFLLK